MRRRALISVSDKTGIVPFARELQEYDIDIISTGGTRKVLEEAGVSTLSIEKVTDFPEMMDGRVKTLHPKIHGGLLGRRGVDSHVEAMETHDIYPIDFVCVNLYPFKETIRKENVTRGEAIENIDIGGPSMLRSAAKNHESVTVVVDPFDYDLILSELEKYQQTSSKTRKHLAAKVFRHTAAYDSLIGQYLTEEDEGNEDNRPESLTLTYDLQQPLRYGENSHQKATFYCDALPVPFSIASATQLHGKKLSYNNIKDADAALRIVREFNEPTVVAVKHMNPCGIGTGDTLLSAYEFAYEADPISIFGGIVALNREVDLTIAEKMHQLFLEIVIAPSFSTEALELLSKKKNIRLLTLDFSQKDKKVVREVVSVMGGLLVQEQDQLEEDEKEWTVVTNRQPSQKEMKAMSFAWKAVKHVKSNGIVVANAHQTLGIGAGQMNRIGAVKIAIEQGKERIEDAVLASDAFFPMGDSVEYAAKHGIKAIIQSGNSIKDEESIAMANQHGIAMVFTGIRHFKH